MQTAVSLLTAVTSDSKSRLLLGELHSVTLGHTSIAAIWHFIMHVTDIQMDD